MEKGPVENPCQKAGKEARTPTIIKKWVYSLLNSPSVARGGQVVTCANKSLIDKKGYSENSSTTKPQAFSLPRLINESSLPSMKS